MFDIPDPVSMFEAARNGSMEREVAEDFLGTSYSGFLSLLWGLRKLPLIGPALGSMAVAMLLSLKNGRMFAQGKLRITVLQEMDNPDLESTYKTIQIGDK